MSVMNTACPICREVFKNAEDIYSTSCGHIFHFACMNDWQRRSTSCPQCRHYNPTTHKLYLSFEDSNENPVEIEEIKTKLKSANEKIERFEEQYKHSQKLKSEVEWQSLVSEENLLKLQGQYTESLEAQKELETQIQLLKIENEFNVKELNLKCSNIKYVNAKIEKIKTKSLKSANEKIQRLRDQVNKTRLNFSLHQKEYTNSEKFKKELELVSLAGKENFLKSQSQYTESLEARKKLETQIQLLIIENESNVKELNLNCSEIESSNTKIEEEIKTKLKRANEQIEQLRDLENKTGFNFSRLQEQYKNSKKLTEELESQLEAGEEVFFKYTGLCTNSFEARKELETQIQLLKIENEFSVKELNLKCNEIQSSNAALLTKVKILKNKLKRITFDFDIVIRNSTQQSIENMKWQSFIDRFTSSLKICVKSTSTEDLCQSRLQIEKIKDYC